MIGLLARAPVSTTAKATVAMGAVLVVYHFSPWPAVSLLALLGFAALAYFRLDVALAFVLLSTPFYLVTHSFGRLAFSPVEVLILACTVAWAARRAVRREFHLPRTPFDVPLAILIVAALASLLVSEHLRESARVLRVVIIEPALFYVLLTDTIRRPSQVLLLVGALVAGGVIIALVCAYQYFLTGDTITAEGVMRVKAFYGSPNNVGLFLGRLLPLAACLAAFGRDRRWAWGAACLAMGVAVVLTYSWGAWLGLGAAALFVGAAGGRRRLARMAGAVAPAGLGLVLLAGGERLRSHLALDEGTTFLRLRLWESALNMLRDHPVFGVGLDNFLYLYRDKYVAGEAIIDLDLSHPHNIILDFWLSLGVVGLVAIGWLLFKFFTKGWEIYRGARDVTQQALALGALASMVDFVVHGLVDNSYFLVDLATIFWFTCGLVVILGRRDGELTWT
ncbi:MAG: O-antigen ligase family protein [Bacteroidetes bacterium]|nr:O-antigen ligase family protein [Bacteroidota bacterium]MCL5026295.1 O-antigen ligase family protein [Chloroflexota bacterium]